MKPSVLFLLPLLVLAVAGCTAPQPGSAASIPLEERVSYRVDTDGARVLDGAHTDLQGTGTLDLTGALLSSTYVVQAHGSFDDPAMQAAFPPSADRATLSFDLATGSLSRVDQATSVVFPVGGERFFPHAYLTGPGSFGAADLVPLGPQWFLLQGQRAVVLPGNVSATIQQAHGNWTIKAEAPCVWACKWVGHDGRQAGSTLLHLELHGLNGRLFPEDAAWTSDAPLNRSFSIHATQHEVSEGRRPLPQASAPAPASPLERTCLEFPCHQGRWPMQVDPQAGTDALRADPRFQAWKGQDVTTWLRLEVAYGDAGLEGRTFADQVLWTIQMVKPSSGEEMAFQLTSVGTNGSWTPPILNSSSKTQDQLAWSLRDAPSTWPAFDGVAAPDVASIRSMVMLHFPGSYAGDGHGALIIVRRLGSMDAFLGERGEHWFHEEQA